MTRRDSADLDADVPDAALSAREGAIELDMLADAFGFLLRRAWRDVERRFNHHFRTIDLSAAQYAIMILLDHNDGCKPGDLVAPMGISQNNLVGIIEDLVRRGFVRKQTDPNDRRARILTLTEEGRGALAAAHQAHADYTQEYRERVGADNLKELVRLLQMFDGGGPP